MTRSSRSAGRRKSAAAKLRSCSARTAELLEPRVLFSTFTVTNANDSGPGSLRQAILDANAGQDLGVITFNIPGPSPHVIAPASALPVITQRVEVMGNTQPGLSFTGAPVIEITGTNAGPGVDGLVLGPTAQNTQIQGLDINRFSGNGIVVQGIGDRIMECYVGTDPTGTIAQGNGKNGVVLAANTATLTGFTQASRNVISGNVMAGVVVAANVSADSIDDSFIGTDANGMTALGNGQAGVLALSSVALDYSSGQRDVISGNGYSGLLLQGSAASTYTIAGAEIGTNVTGTAAIPNGLSPAAPYRDGITVLSGKATIGRTTSTLFPPTVISGNRGAGVYLGGSSQSNLIGSLVGTDGTGSLPIGNDGPGVVIATDHVAFGSFSSTTAASPITASGGNVIAANRGDGILILSSGVSVVNQYVGLNIAGAPMGNGGDGIEIRGGTQNTIGVTNVSTVARNIISGNGGAGVSITGGGLTADAVRSNYIGTDVAGNAPVPNEGNGVEVFSSGNTISGNLISGNGGSGVLLGPGPTGPSSGNMVLNNTIGLPAQQGGQMLIADASVLFPNGLGNQGDGITVLHSNGNVITGNRVNANGLDGIDLVGANANTMTNDVATGNGSNGIDIVGGSNNTLTGNTVTGNANNGVGVRESVPGASDALGNTIAQGSFASNGGLPIDLGDDGPTPNDPGDVDTGPNNLQNFPVIVSIATLPNGTPTVLRLLLDTAPGTYNIDLYRTAGPDSSVSAPYQFAGAARITVGTDPTAIYSVQVDTIAVGQIVRATATGTDGTSELSEPATVVSLPPKVVNKGYQFFNPSRPVMFQFDQDVSASLTPAALKLHNEQTGQDFSAAAVFYNHDLNIARFSLPASLPAGDYVATLLASVVTNSLGQHLDGNGDGVAGDDSSFTFAYVPGDLNGDGVVNFADLLRLVQSYGTNYSGVDVNGDGIVNFDDLLILAQNYGTSVPVV